MTWIGQSANNVQWQEPISFVNLRAALVLVLGVGLSNWFVASLARAEDTHPLIGLKLDNVGKLEPNHTAFQAIYNRAMQDLPLPIRPSLTTVHCNTEDMNMFSVRVSVGQQEDEIWLAQDDEWQFANSVSLEVFMRKHGADVKELAKSAHKAGQRAKKK